MHVVLETERLLLRRFTADDVDLLVELYDDPEVMHFVNGGHPVAREEIADDELPAFLAFDERPEGYGFLAAMERGAVGESPRFVGWFHLRPPDGGDPLDPELGYRLRRSAWGRGLATEGSQALVDHAFAVLGARRVHAETMVVHTASRRVMEKVGMRVVRTFHADWPVRIPGDEHGDVECAIEREDWLAAQHARRGRGHVV